MKNFSSSLWVPIVHSFFDSATNTVSHVVVDPETRKCAIIDSVLDYEANAAKISYESADKIIHFIISENLEVQWIIETHAHADHLSAAPYIQKILGWIIAIWEHIKEVQEVFGKVFNFWTEFQRDASQFDYLFQDGDNFKLWNITASVMHTPGHTPADMTYVIWDAAFVGDTLFMPDFGTARCDFPGWSAETMYQSIQKIYTLPEKTRIFLCHDYLPEWREDYVWETTVGEQKQKNIHVATHKEKEEFIEMRTQRDKNLAMPKLIIPSIQTNICAWNLPNAEDNGTQYLKIPINRF